MKKLTFWAVALIAMTLLSAFGLARARADVLNLTINSAQYFDGQYFVGPYHSTISRDEPALSFPAITFCIDFESHVGFGQPFAVAAINLANFTGPLKQDYWEAGYIYLQMSNTTDVAILSAMQRAAWLITSPGSSDPYLLTDAAFAWLLQAQQNYQSVDPSRFTLYLKAGDEGQSQLAINSVPEPAAYAIALMAFGALFIVTDLRRRLRR